MQRTNPKTKQERLGPIAAVLLPIEKLKDTSPHGRPYEREIHDYLVGHFNGYTVSSGNISGHWKDDSGRDHYGEHREYKVALPNKESATELQDYLAQLASEMGEECIYAEFGAEIFLIYSRRKRAPLKG